MSSHTVDAEALVQAIRGPSPAYKRRVVDAIVAAREQTTPLLLRLLEQMADDPAGFADALGDDDFDPVYVVSLLAHLREPRAHAPLLRLARLPSDVFDPLLGGFATEGLGALLLATSGGTADGILGLLADRAAPEVARMHAAETLVLAVRLGYAPRAEVLRALAAGLAEPDDGKVDTPWTEFASAMLDLRAIEYQDELRRAWDEELLLDGELGDWPEIEAELSAPPNDDAPSASFAAFVDGDVHGWIGRWSCFAIAARTGPRRKLARNGPCWCGSGRKYKGCHEASDRA